MKTIEELKKDLDSTITLLKRFTQHQLPEAETATDSEAVLCIPHMDHEHYRHSVRLAEEFVAAQAAE